MSSSSFSQDSAKPNGSRILAHSNSMRLAGLGRPSIMNSHDPSDMLQEPKHNDNGHSSASSGSLESYNPFKGAANFSEGQAISTGIERAGGKEGSEGRTDRNITWSELTSQLKGTPWETLKGTEPGTIMNRVYANRILDCFDITHIEHTGFLWHRLSVTIVCLCYEGIFMFGGEFEYVCLVAKTCKGALKYMLDVNIGCEGEPRAGKKHNYCKGIGKFDMFLEEAKMIESGKRDTDGVN